jgi:hypothetical protein
MAQAFHRLRGGNMFSLGRNSPPLNGSKDFPNGSRAHQMAPRVAPPRGFRAPPRRPCPAGAHGQVSGRVPETALSRNRALSKPRSLETAPSRNRALSKPRPLETALSRPLTLDNSVQGEGAGEENSRRGGRAAPRTHPQLLYRAAGGGEGEATPEAGPEPPSTRGRVRRAAGQKWLQWQRAPLEPFCAARRRPRGARPARMAPAPRRRRRRPRRGGALGRRPDRWSHFGRWSHLGPPPRPAAAACE